MFMVENFMHEVVYSPIFQENRLDEKVITGNIWGKIFTFMQENEIFMPQLFHTCNLSYEL